MVICNYKLNLDTRCCTGKWIIVIVLLQVPESCCIKAQTNDQEPKRAKDVTACMREASFYQLNTTSDEYAQYVNTRVIVMGYVSHRNVSRALFC